MNTQTETEIMTVGKQEPFRFADLYPIQDPSARTNENLMREIAALKELIFVRLEGMDKAILLFDKNLNRFPTDVDKQVGHLQELVLERFKVEDERFIGVQKQFDERDVRNEQTTRDSKTAIDAALQAAKEAVGAQNTASAMAITKSEAATAKSMDQMAVLVQSMGAAINVSISDLKDRLTRLEGMNQGEATQKTEHRGQTMNLVSIVGLLVGAVIGISGIILNIVK